jgi:hypothetical protein
VVPFCIISFEEEILKMAKAKAPKKEVVEVPKGLSVKVNLEKTAKGRITVKVTLLQDGVEISSDYDFVQV